jgi:ech hydrogenase subunit A
VFTSFLPIEPLFAEGGALFESALIPVVLLVLFPMLAAALQLVVRTDAPRRLLTVAAAILIAAGSIWLAVDILVAGELRLNIGLPFIEYLFFAVDLIIAAYIIYRGLKHRRLLAVGLASLQLILAVIYEFSLSSSIVIYTEIYLDSLTAIMVLIIGIIGSGICVYSLGYMRDFQAHDSVIASSAGTKQPVIASAESAKQPSHAATTPEIVAAATPETVSPVSQEDPEAEAQPGSKDRRPVFFALMFLFLSAMFLLVVSNKLTWLLCAWEITTVCSFALIGYTRTEEAITNAFRQIVMNLLGGVGFSLALLIVGLSQIGELDLLIALGANPGLFSISVALPIALLAFAGITKAAQMPFQSWLLGAMVAPTPTSALLHSSTMVKAGVFLLIRLAPTFGFNGNGMMVMLIGGLTFLFCSLLAISQSNAKRVLAYSTVANLGLIVACAGVGTPEAVWAATFLLIFHAAAKSLLFLCVGTAEHHIGSRDIEDMDNLFVRMPTLAKLMALGMLVMFIAPFGMLIAKWAVIVSLVQTSNLVLLVILAFGSAATFMFWAKWLGKMLAIAQSESNLEHKVHRSEWAALILMAALTVLLSVGFPFISEYLVVPWLANSMSAFFLLRPGSWAAVAPAISFDNLLIMAVLVLVLIVVFIIFFGRSKKRQVPIYLAGLGIDFDKRSYRDALSQPRVAVQRNWYMEDWFGEKTLAPIANVMCTAIIVLGIFLGTLALLGIVLPWGV